VSMMAAFSHKTFVRNEGRRCNRRSAAIRGHVQQKCRALRLEYVAVRLSAFGTKRTFRSKLAMSAFGGKADTAQGVALRPLLTPSCPHSCAHHCGAASRCAL